MLTYFVFKEFVYELLIDDMLKYGEAGEKSFALLMIIPAILYGILCMFVDIVFIPLYILWGLLTLIIKLFERR